MNPAHDSNQDDLFSKINLWGPRILVGLSIVLLLYFTFRTYRFNGYFDETFLSENNLELSRGPLAPRDYYARGLLDYEPKPLFVSSEEEEVSPEEVSPAIKEIIESEDDAEMKVSPVDQSPATPQTEPAS